VHGAVEAAAPAVGTVDDFNPVDAERLIETQQQPFIARIEGMVGGCAVVIETIRGPRRTAVRRTLAGGERRRHRSVRLTAGLATAPSVTRVTSDLFHMSRCPLAASTPSVALWSAPATKQAVSPGRRFNANASTVANGCAAVPAFASRPVVPM
jgi:hypothetical protein